jgi:hypothetical protein
MAPDEDGTFSDEVTITPNYDENDVGYRALRVTTRDDYRRAFMTQYSSYLP